MAGSKAELIERKYKAPREGGGLRGLSWEFLNPGGFMVLLEGCFSLINPPFTCHPISFLSSIYHMGKSGGLLHGGCPCKGGFCLGQPASCPSLSFFQLSLITFTLSFFVLILQSHS